MKLPSWLRRKPRLTPYHGPVVYVHHEGLYNWISRVFFTDTIYDGFGQFNELELNLRQIPEVKAVRIYTHYVAVEWRESAPIGGDIEEVLEHKSTQILNALEAYFERLPLELREQPSINDRPLLRPYSVYEIHKQDYRQLWYLGNDKDKLSDWHERDNGHTRAEPR